MNDYSLLKLQNDIKAHSFFETYKSIFFNKIKELNESEIIKMLELAILLINSKNESLFDLGYYIIVNYSIQTGNYIPLFEISERMMNFPIINFLYKKNLVISEDNFFTEIEKSAMKQLKISENYFYTAEQKIMNHVFFERDTNISVIAPTSFGKTELIKKYVKNNYKEKVICILEPTKSMLNQVRNDILNEFTDMEKPKIITHYDMNFNDDERIVLIMTQERLFKLIYDRKRNIHIDALLIDEAHNIFEKNSRAFLLAKTIYLLKNKNLNLVVKYFSPIIDSSDNLKLKNDNDIIPEQLKINPKMKVEKYYFADFFTKKKYIYDQFLNDFYCCGELGRVDKYEYIIENSSSKNLIYLNRPKHIKDELSKIEKYLPINSNNNIEKICKTLEDYVSKDYDLIDYIRKGVAYHFGSMPDNVRNYVEKCVKEENNLKYIFCTSTLLEGVNMPFDKLFILDLKKGRANLTYHHLKNLIGRVNRYNNIFDLRNNYLDGLISKVYFIKERSEKSSFEHFIKENLKVKSNSKSRKDIVKNALLENGSEELSRTDMDTIENLKENNSNCNYRKVKTSIGKTLLELNINDFDVFEYEELIDYRIKNNIIQEDDSIVEKIYKLFINNIELTSDNNYLLKRLENISARNFYNMIISWRKENLSLKERVSRLVYYWDNLNRDEKELIYIGKSFGEIRRTDDDQIPLYVNLNIKSRKEIINLAIIRIKEEDDYVDYNLFKYIDFLHKYELIDKSDYNLLHYGTVDDVQIYFQREGLSRELSKLLSNKYKNYLIKRLSSYYINKAIINVFDDNDVLKYELENYLT